MPIQATGKIWMDGEYVDWDEARVHVLTPSLHYGWGVFEGIRAYQTDGGGSAVFRLTDHMERLFRSAKIYHMEPPVSLEGAVKVTKDLVAMNGVPTCYVRPIVYLGFGEMGLNPLNSPVRMAIACWPWGAYLGEEAFETGVRVKVSSWRRLDANIIPPAAKATGQYLNSSLAKAEAVKAGYDEGILLNSNGYVTDGSGENVFVVRDGVLCTPPLAAGCLAGITRASILQIAADEGIRVSEADMVRTDLYLADEAFFTGTAAEVVPIREVDDRVLGDPGPITRRLQEVFTAATKGRDERYRDWLEPVT
ncbi:MAG TPA: branched-chain amino acid transaminase [Actinomycetes bacterium]|jgi:branched-chain amino acid aminotransferase|nr:branched-chain amino acid transaminase [Actinomycetes bacterium]